MLHHKADIAVPAPQVGVESDHLRRLEPIVGDEVEYQFVGPVDPSDGIQFGCPIVGSLLLGPIHGHVDELTQRSIALYSWNPVYL